MDRASASGNPLGEPTAGSHELTEPRSFEHFRTVPGATLTHGDPLVKYSPAEDAPSPSGQQGQTRVSEGRVLTCCVVCESVQKPEMMCDASSTTSEADRWRGTAARRRPRWR